RIEVARCCELATQASQFVADRRILVVEAIGCIAGGPRKAIGVAKPRTLSLELGPFSRTRTDLVDRGELEPQERLPVTATSLDPIEFSDLSGSRHELVDDLSEPDAVGFEPRIGIEVDEVRCGIRQRHAFVLR